MYIAFLTPVTVFIGDPHKVIWGHLSSPTVFLRISFDSEEIGTWEWFHCVSHQYASIHMQYDLLGWKRDPDQMSNFDLDLSRSYLHFHSIPLWTIPFHFHYEPLPPITWLLMALDKKITFSVFLLSRRTPFDCFLFITFGRLLFPKIKILFSGHVGSLTSDDSVVPWSHFNTY